MVTLKREDLLILKELFCIYFICHSGGQVQAYIDIYERNPIIWNSGGISPLMF